MTGGSIMDEFFRVHLGEPPADSLQPDELVTDVCVVAGGIPLPRQLRKRVKELKRRRNKKID